MFEHSITKLINNVKLKKMTARPRRVLEDKISEAAEMREKICNELKIVLGMERSRKTSSSLVYIVQNEKKYPLN